MDCRITDESNSQIKSDPGETNCRDENHCPRCAGQGRPVLRKTVLLMLKPGLLNAATSASYRFCAANDCPVVYFEDEGSRQFTVDDLRIRVGLKVKEDPIPLCYCFGFEECDIRDEISRTGTTTIPARVASLIREGLCACDSRNPVGVCCLGEITNVAKLLLSQVRKLRASDVA